jgi:hypothetical protein
MLKKSVRDAGEWSELGRVREVLEDLLPCWGKEAS